MSQTYHQRVYSGHNAAIIGMDYMRSGRYRRDGVKHCWNLMQRGKLAMRDGGEMVHALPGSVTWGRYGAGHSFTGHGNTVWAG